MNSRTPESRSRSSSRRHDRSRDRAHDQLSREERKEATRRAIVSAALHLLAEHSFSGLSLREVTREAGISPAAFYRHFESMEALGLVLIDESFRSLRDMLRGARAGKLDPTRVIESSVDILIDGVQQRREHWRFIGRERSSGVTVLRYAIRTEIRLITSELAIDLARLVDARMLIVHVSEAEAAHSILQARNNELSIYGETCPQYLFLTAKDLDQEGMEGAKYCCSPPPRDKASQEAIWKGLKNGTFQVFSSDHAPYRFDESGKFHAGRDASFNKIANGVPGLETRMPLLFSEGVGKGRITINEFVALTSTNAAKIYGLYPRKGSLVIGSDADIAIWDPKWVRTIKQEMLHDNMDYTPYDGMEVKGWPRVVINRGRMVVEEETLKVDRGSGEFLPRTPAEAGRELPISSPLSPSRNFGAKLL